MHVPLNDDPVPIPGKEHDADRLREEDCGKHRQQQPAEEGSGQSVRPLHGRAGASSAGLDADTDDIALPIHRLDDLGCTRIIPENLSQAADADIDAAIQGIRFASAQELGQLRARQHAIG